MKFTFFTVAFSLFIILLIPTSVKANDLNTFLEDHALEVSEATIIQRIPFFLDPRYRKKSIFWYDGSIVSADGFEYSGLKLKFNTVSNTVYLKHGGSFYSIPTHAISGFTIIDKGVMRHFKKGYSETFVHAVSASFRSDPMTVMRNISNYDKKEDFRLQGVYMESANPEFTDVTIEFSTKRVTLVTEFNNFLMFVEGAVTSEIVSEIPDFDENTLLEVKVLGKNGDFLKLNYKDVSASQNMTQIKQSDTNTYNKYSYFLANENKEIKEFLFNKRSIKKALEFVGIRYRGAIPSMNSEKQVAAWLKKVL